ncbi:hypothetical protein HYALB_00000438 [Hymenoscyphus albidus]|uniref:Uncharacterized protein n=1 Tax=Hymenoscyphus albidus TaxID=595503 RepID=A0A9N9LGM7_9HELO|nr:hypothetical protein HYALB_00000438 [Hymenoscyphus albidus]
MGSSRHKRAQLASPHDNQKSKKRKAANTDDEYDSPDLEETKPKRARKKNGEEKRLKRHRARPPRTYIERLHRVRIQRMFLLDRNRSTSEDGTHEEEVFDIAGTTGNVYNVTISKVLDCSCPDSSKGNQCKHIIYVLVNVLKAREDLAYQLAFLTTELEEIFSNAPVRPQSDGATATATETGGHRKPIEGDCPICVMEFEESDKSDTIIWCKAACGNNVHKRCFDRWARSKPGEVKCVYCRTPWKGDEKDLKGISKRGKVNEEGYVNVAGQLGLSGHRDTSTYHEHWARREFGGGYY